MSFPENITTVPITGRLLAGTVDGPNPTTKRSAVSARFLVEFTPEVTKIPAPEADGGPTTFYRGGGLPFAPVMGVVDSRGYLCTPDPDNRAIPLFEGVRLIATDDAALSVKDWTWRVTIRTLDGKTVESYPIAVPAAAAVNGLDLTNLAPVPSTPGYGIPQAEAAAAMAAQNSTKALQSVERAEATVEAVAEKALTSGAVVGDDLILSRQNGGTINAGNVRGPQGIPGPNTVPTEVAIAAFVESAGIDRPALDAAYASFVSAREFGATGDGATDDTAAIQAALDAGAGDLVRIPAGTYKITGRLDIKAGTTLDATGATLNAHWPAGVNDGIILTNGVPGDTPMGYTGRGNFTIIGGIWDARGHLNTAAFSSTFAFAHAENITLRDVIMRNVCRGHAVDLAGCKGVRFLNCRFEGYTDNGSPRGTEALQIDVSTQGTFPTFGGWDATPCLDVVVDGCVFTSSAECGVWPRGVGSHSARVDRQHKAVKITKCDMYCSDYGIRAYNWADFKFSNNNLTGCRIAIIAISTTTITDDNKNAAGVQTNSSAPIFSGVVESNTITGAQVYPIWVTGDAADGWISDVRIDKNQISGQTVGAYDGINLNRTTDCMVTRNTIRDALANGIRMGTCNRVVVSENLVQSSFGHGIMLDSSSDCLLSGNTVRYSGDHGISLSSSGGGHTIQGNKVTGSSTKVNLAGVGIRLNGVANCMVVGNMVRRGTLTNKAGYGLQIASGASGTFYTGNDLRDSGTTGSVLDQGVGSITTPSAA